MNEKEYGIKLRDKGGKAWRFLTPRGGSIRLKIHAARFSSRPEAQVAQLTADNPELEFKVVAL